MGARGPARAPVEQRRARSRSTTRDNQGRELPDRSQITALPGCGDEPPPLPASILDDGPGADRWRKTWTVARDWISPQTDIWTVTRLCEAEDMRAAMLEQIRLDSMMILGSMGQLRPNPLIDKVRQLDDQLTRYEGLLGLNPSARGALGVAEMTDKPQSPLERLMAEQVAKRDRIAKRG